MDLRGQQETLSAWAAGAAAQTYATIERIGRAFAA
jgi:hypothetical protein